MARFIDKMGINITSTEKMGDRVNHSLEVFKKSSPRSKFKLRCIFDSETIDIM
jgi:hypothetical protein